MTGGVPRRCTAVVAAVLAFALLGGCGMSGRDDGDSASSAATSMPALADGADSAESSGGGTGVDVRTAATIAPDVVEQDRAIVYTASMTVAVGDIREAVGRVRAVATGAGGRLHDEQTSGTDDSTMSTLVLKVAPDRFDSALDQIAALGEEQGRDVNAADVTADVVDLEARIKSATASVERTRALLAQAKDVGEIVVIEGELAKRETALEQLLGQQRVLDAAVALATITVTLVEADDAAAAGDDAGGLPGPLDALRAGGESVLAVFSVAVLVLAVSLPWLPVVGAILAIVWLVRRRRAPVAASGPAAP